ncbi:MAG: class I SAM-dependent methyltransferase [Rubripirellula sp.]|nr:class I SAM-dependent methyltransferase [Rubripirellula sp.]
MPYLDARLKKVAQQIRTTVHVDLGSDHANLLVALLKSGRIERGIAIENKQQPFLHSRRALQGLDAEARFAEGLEGLVPGEADSLSICGMGAENIVSILAANPDCIPPLVILQPNRRAELIRQWGLDSGFHLLDEQIAHGHWPYVILTYRKADAVSDPAYTKVDHEADLLLGPWLLKRREERFVAQIQEEQQYWQQFERISDESVLRRDTIERVLTRWKLR